MDPYKTPQSNAAPEPQAAPGTIIVSYFVIGLSFIIFLVEEITYSVYVAENPFDAFNYLFIPLWAGVLYWVATSIKKREKNPRNTFLILAVVVAALSILSPVGEYSIYTGLAESVCFLVVYMLLSTKQSKSWFL